MHTHLLSLLSRRLLITLLLVGLALGSVSLALIEHPFSVDAAASHPYYAMVIGGQKYIAQYEGGAYNSNVTSHSIYTDFGHWNEYTVDSHGTWHWYGQFSGNENTYVNGHGQLQTGVNVNVPGVGHINTYGHEDVLNPHLTPPPAGYVAGHESYFGARLDVKPSHMPPAECEVDASNVANGRYGSGTRQFFLSGHDSQQEKDCGDANYFFRAGDPGIGGIVRHLALSRPANGSMFASLLHPQVLPVPVILGIASGVFFIGATVTGNVCAFVSCGNTAKKVLAGVALGMGIISGVLGISSGILTAMKAYGAQGPAAIAAVGQEAAGAVETTGTVSPSLASRAASEVVTISDLSARSSISVLP